MYFFLVRFRACFGFIALRAILAQVRQHIAAGFDPSSYVTLALDKGHNDGGIPMLNNDGTNHIKPNTKEQTLHLLKFHSWLACLPELG
jgi:hypothetical protein